MSIVAVLKSEHVIDDSKKFYELSARGPLVRYLRGQIHDLTVSEYYDDVLPGNYRESVQCQNVQKLTYADNSFDVCTSTDVFEHVPDDMQGFLEILRVLKPGGVFIFTVPLSEVEDTVERAVMKNDGIHHIHPATYHGDAIRGSNRVLVYRDYGQDIQTRLRKAGFSSVRIIKSEANRYLDFGSNVIVARV